MSLFTDIVDQVYTLTNRPDLVAETELAVKQATLKGHQSDYYYRDILETAINFGAASYFQTLGVKGLLPRYRAVKWARKYDAVGEEAGKFFDLVLPEQTLDSYNQNRTDIMYAAGDVLQFRSSTEFQYILFGCYQNPELSSASYNSWIAQDHPYYIVTEATRIVFKAIGYDAQEATFNRLAMEQLQGLKLSNIVAGGY